MKYVIYKNKKVKVVDFIIEEVKYVTAPVLTQVKIQYKEDGEVFDEWVSTSKIGFC